MSTDEFNYRAAPTIQAKRVFTRDVGINLKHKNNIGKKVKQIRREKAQLIDKLLSEGVSPQVAYTQAGEFINNKYGKGWAER